MSRPIVLAGLVIALSAANSGAASAASTATEAFVANVRPNIDFLDRSSRLALDKSGRRAVRSFAHEEALEQTVASDSLVAWTQTSTTRGMAVALSRPDASNPISDLAALPRNVIGAVAGGADALVTGRSVALDPPLTVQRTATGVAPAAGGLLPAGEDNLARLARTSGRRFDSLYQTTQLDALRQLSILYRDYAAGGDDPSLRALALRELPRVNGRIVALRRL